MRRAEGREHGKRDALLIRCTAEEAELIRNAAQRERRTISGFILHAVMNRITTQHKLQAQSQESLANKKLAKRKSAGQGES
jgi:uncharacterized protein (DUF1778 family)